eukprot:TRINITY_DN8410_c0_g1_i5.p9 TRINITY_DN8410_c0_g1~~TRINITY_DN8410_c0_g1_i5.p9  ORF type:complete len:143 (+),score=27.99 TRINITY_DN8410_c0_g1_i5:2506-2934(+)
MAALAGTAQLAELLLDGIGTAIRCHLGQFIGFLVEGHGRLAQLFLVSPDIRFGAGFFPALALVGARQIQGAHAGIGNGLDGVGRLDHLVLVVVAAFDVHLDTGHVPGHEAIAGLAPLDGIFRLDLGGGGTCQRRAEQYQQQF